MAEYIALNLLAGKKGAGNNKIAGLF